MGNPGKGIWAWKVDTCVNGRGRGWVSVSLECLLEMGIGDCEKNKEMSLKTDIWGGKLGFGELRKRMSRL